MTTEEIRALLGAKMRPGVTNDPRILVDADNQWLLSEYKWQVAENSHGNTCYVWRTVYVTKGKLLHVALHRLVLGDLQRRIDHINGDGLDNRRENLRAATNAQNQANVALQGNNSSGYKGVAWSGVVKKWRAQIGGDSKRRHLGYFDCPEDAARAYDRALVERYGEFALTNAAMGLYGNLTVEVAE